MEIIFKNYFLGKVFFIISGIFGAFYSISLLLLKTPNNDCSSIFLVGSDVNDVIGALQHNTFNEGKHYF